VIVEQQKQLRWLEYQQHQTYTQHPRNIRIWSCNIDERTIIFVLLQHTCFFNSSAISWAPTAWLPSDDFSGGATYIFEEASIFYNTNTKKKFFFSSIVNNEILYTDIRQVRKVFVCNSLFLTWRKIAAYILSTKKKEKKKKPCAFFSQQKKNTNFC
jgi:hypothetical protein